MGARVLSLAPQTTESPAMRASRLLAEAKGAAAEQVQALEQALEGVIRLSNEIAEGGDAYPPGARDLARRLAEDSEHRLKTLEAIQLRAQ